MQVWYIEIEFLDVWRKTCMKKKKLTLTANSIGNKHLFALHIIPTPPISIPPFNYFTHTHTFLSVFTYCCVYEMNIQWEFSMWRRQTSFSLALHKWIFNQLREGESYYSCVAFWWWVISMLLCFNIYLVANYTRVRFQGYPPIIIGSDFPRTEIYARKGIHFIVRIKY